MTNYFDFYGIPEAFHVDEAFVKRKFYSLSKEYHPDFFINEAKEKQDEILELSTVNNKAYQVLSDRRRRIEYILDLHQLIEEGEKYQLPQSFLMEMMDVNEALMELELDPDSSAAERLSAQVAGIEGVINSDLEALTLRFDSTDDILKNSILLQIKDLWYRQKYLLRIRNSLNKFATR